jgi:hypothetical protein
VSAPAKVAARQPFVARLVAYPPSQADQAKRQLEGATGRATAALDVSACRWPVGTRLSVTLSGQGIELAEPTVDALWDGGVTEAAFDVTVTSDASEVILRFDVRANDLPVAAPRLEVSVRRRRASRRAARAEVTAATTAFASYAHADRMRVLDAVVALEAIGVDVFQDCLDLHPGEQYKSRLHRELADRDVFLLFWSRAASSSRWVAWELGTVLDSRGREPLCVCPLEPDVPPPEQLADLHFDHPGVWLRAALSPAG